MRRFARLALFVLLATGLSAGGQPPPKRMIEFSEADRADLARVSAYLNSIHSLKGDFVQLGPDGQADPGHFYLQKPGRLRFEYNPPNPMLVVADGRYLIVANRKMKTVDRTPLSFTPLDLILGDDIDLLHNSAILAVKHEPGILIIQARSSDNRSRANIALVFSDPVLELRQWTVLDDQGLETTVALRGLENGPVLDPSLFVLEDMKRPVGVKPRD
ncbi:MAG: outer-membrane lipoprotein carrier protein LolA [Rhizomicrobium sp.]